MIQRERSVRKTVYYPKTINNQHKVQTRIFKNKSSNCLLNLFCAKYCAQTALYK